MMKRTLLLAFIASTADGFTSHSRPISQTTTTAVRTAQVAPQFSAPLSPTKLWNHKKPLEVIDVEIESETEVNRKPSAVPATKKSTNPTPVLFKYFQELSANHAAFAAVAALALSLILTPLPSFAAMSGGRMGGSFSAPRSSSSYSGRTMSAPSYRSGYSRGFGSGYGAGYYSRGPSVIVAPPPLVTPFNPFYSPGYYGGAGVMAWRGPSFFDLLFFGGLALFAVNAVSNFGRSVTESTLDSDFGFGGATASALGSGTSVVEVSVALEVSNREDRNSILSALQRLSQTARTDSRVGIQNLTSQVALELLRRKSSIVSASSNYKHFGSRDKALREFNRASIKQRGKFERETVSKFGGFDYSQGSDNSWGTRGDSSRATMAVVTLVLAIDGDSTKVPNINSISDLEEALRKIAADSKVDDCLQGAEILWTPEERSETLTPRDVVADYPELRSI